MGNRPGRSADAWHRTVARIADDFRCIYDFLSLGFPPDGTCVPRLRRTTERLLRRPRPSAVVPVRRDPIAERSVVLRRTQWVDDPEIDNGGLCVGCRRRLAGVRALPCRHKVLCHRCFGGSVRSRSDADGRRGAGGASVRCPACGRPVGYAQRDPDPDPGPGAPPMDVPADRPLLRMLRHFQRFHRSLTDPAVEIDRAAWAAVLPLLDAAVRTVRLRSAAGRSLARIREDPVDGGGPHDRSPGSGLTRTR